MRTLSFLQLVDYFMALCVRQRHLVQQAIGTDMNTGKLAPVFFYFIGLCLCFIGLCLYL